MFRGFPAVLVLQEGFAPSPVPSGCVFLPIVLLLLTRENPLAAAANGEEDDFAVASASLGVYLNSVAHKELAFDRLESLFSGHDKGSQPDDEDDRFLAAVRAIEAKVKHLEEKLDTEPEPGPVFSCSSPYPEKCCKFSTSAKDTTTAAGNVIVSVLNNMAPLDVILIRIGDDGPKGKRFEERVHGALSADRDRFSIVRRNGTHFWSVGSKTCPEKQSFDEAEETFGGVMAKVYEIVDSWGGGAEKRRATDGAIRDRGHLLLLWVAEDGVGLLENEAKTLKAFEEMAEMTNSDRKVFVHLYDTPPHIFPAGYNSWNLRVKGPSKLPEDPAGVARELSVLVDGDQGSEHHSSPVLAFRTFGTANESRQFLTLGRRWRTPTEQPEDKDGPDCFGSTVEAVDVDMSVLLAEFVAEFYRRPSSIATDDRGRLGPPYWFVLHSNLNIVLHPLLQGPQGQPSQGDGGPASVIELDLFEPDLFDARDRLQGQAFGNLTVGAKIFRWARIGKTPLIAVSVRLVGTNTSHVVPEMAPDEDDRSEQRPYVVFRGPNSVEMINKSTATKIDSRLCKHFNVPATLEAGSVELLPEALDDFNRGFPGQVEPQTIDVKDAGQSVQSEISKATAVTERWKNSSYSSIYNNYIVRRYLVTAHGVLFSYPGAWNPGQHPKSQDWHRKALRHPASVVLSSPRLDPSGAGLVFTLSRVLLKGSAGGASRHYAGAVAMDVTLGFLKQMVDDVLPGLCQSSIGLLQVKPGSNSRCFLFDETGYAIVHPSMFLPTQTQDFRRMHLAHLEPLVLSDLLALIRRSKVTVADGGSMFMEKRFCLDRVAGVRRSLQRHYRFHLNLKRHLEDLQPTLERTVGRCHSYRISPLAGTNAFLGVVADSCASLDDAAANLTNIAAQPHSGPGTIAPFCPCDMKGTNRCMVCRDDGNDREDLKETCECPCECEIPAMACRDRRRAAVSEQLCSDTLDDVKELPEQWGRPEAVAHLPDCFVTECSLKVGEKTCVGVIGCSWCAGKVQLGSLSPWEPLKGPLCTRQSECFYGIRGLPSPYEDILQRHRQLQEVVVTSSSMGGAQHFKGREGGQDTLPLFFSRPTTSVGPIAGGIIGAFVLVLLGVYCYKSSVFFRPDGANSGGGGSSSSRSDLVTGAAVNDHEGSDPANATAMQEMVGFVTTDVLVCDDDDGDVENDSSSVSVLLDDDDDDGIVLAQRPAKKKVPKLHLLPSPYQVAVAAKPYHPRRQFPAPEDSDPGYSTVTQPTIASGADFSEASSDVRTDPGGGWGKLGRLRQGQHDRRRQAPPPFYSRIIPQAASMLSNATSGVSSRTSSPSLNPVDQVAAAPSGELGADPLQLQPGSGGAKGSNQIVVEVTVHRSSSDAMSFPELKDQGCAAEQSSQTPELMSRTKNSPTTISAMVESDGKSVVGEDQVVFSPNSEVK